MILLYELNIGDFDFVLPAAAIRIPESIGENDVAAKSLKDEFYVLQFGWRQEREEKWRPFCNNFVFNETVKNCLLKKKERVGWSVYIASIIGGDPVRPRRDAV